MPDVLSAPGLYQSLFILMTYVRTPQIQLSLWSWHINSCIHDHYTLEGTRDAFPLLQNLDSRKLSAVCRTLSCPSLLKNQASRVILEEIALVKGGDADWNTLGQPEQGKKCMRSDCKEVNHAHAHDSNLSLAAITLE